MAVKTFNTGRVGTKHRGQWGGSTQYNFMDTAFYNDGALYINIYTGITPIGTPPTNTIYWMTYVPSPNIQIPERHALGTFLVESTIGIYARNMMFKFPNGLIITHFNLVCNRLADGLILFQVPAGYRPYGQVYTTVITTNNTAQLVGMNDIGQCYTSGAPLSPTLSGTLTYYALN